MNHMTRVGVGVGPVATGSILLMTRVNHALHDVSAWLRVMDFDAIEVEYRGNYGRGGFLTPRCYRRSQGNPWTVVGERGATFVHTVTILLVSRYPGWQTACRSRGEFRWDCNLQDLIHTHYSRSKYVDRIPVQASEASSSLAPAIRR